MKRVPATTNGSVAEELPYTNGFADSAPPLPTPTLTHTAQFPSPFPLPAYASLPETIPADLRQKMQTAHPLAGERRRVTILFADVQSYTQYTEMLDPEEVYSLMNAWSRSLATCIYEYEGYVDKILGDGVMALFGAPITHEDDPERAVRAALRMQETMKEINREAQVRWGIELPLRIGIHTGLVVAGNMGADLYLEYTVMGDVVNTTSRLQGLAEPGGILVSDPVRRATERVVEYGSSREVNLRGRSQPVRAYQVTGIRNTPDTSSSLDGFFCPLIGRDEVLEELRETLAEVMAGRGQVFLLKGEAGLGKSRLIREIRQELETLEISSLLGRCSSYGSGLAYLPFQSVLLRLLHLDGSEDDEVIRQRAVEICCGLPDLPEHSATALGLILRRNWGSLDFHALDPMARRTLAHDSFLALLLAEVERGPLALILEDLHWADRESLDLFEDVIEAITDRPVLLLGVYRPDLKSRWVEKSHCVERELLPLTTGQTLDMMEALLDGTKLPHDLRELLLEKAGGNPFFLEELLRTLIERGTLTKSESGWKMGPEEEMADLPDTLYAVVLARLDRLGEAERTVLQCASVIGKQFMARVLERLEDIPPNLYEILEQLLRDEFIYELFGTREKEYAFRQAVTQEVAYGTLLQTTRRQLHGRVARETEALFSPQVEPYLPLLAFHYTRSDDARRGLEFSILAGDQAARAYAVSEMDAHYKDALALLNGGAFDPATTNAMRVHIQETLADARFFAGEYAAAETLYRDALLQCDSPSEEKTGPRRAAALERKMAIALLRIGQLEAAVEHLEACRARLEPLARQLPIDVAAGDAWLAWIRYNQGRKDEAVQLAEDALERLVPGGLAPDWGLPIAISGNQRLRESAWGLAENVLGNVAMAQCRWVDAEIHYERALSQFDTAGDMAFYSGVLSNLAIVHWSCDRYAKARDSALQSLSIQERIGFVYSQIACHTILGLIYMTVGDYRQSRKELTHALSLAQSSKDTHSVAEEHLNLAQLYLASGEIEEAEDSLRAARPFVASLEDPGLEASCQGIEGWLLLEEGKPEMALPRLEKALALARQYEMPDIEAQARLCLIRLMIQGGDLEAAEETLNDLFSRPIEMMAGEIRVKALRLRGGLEARRGKVVQAEETLRECQRTCQSLGLQHEEIRVGIVLGRLFQQQCRYFEAERDYRQALERAEEIGVAMDANRIREYLSDLQLFTVEPEKAALPAGEE